MSAQHRQPARRRWLCVAYAFPPINRSGTHRTLGFVRHLDRLGWDATVLTVKPRSEALDETLARDVPRSTQVIRVECPDLIEKAKGCLGRFTLGSRHVETSAGASMAGASDKGSAASSKPRAKGIRDWVSRLLMTPDSRVGWVPAAVRAARRAIRKERLELIYSTSPYVSAHLIAMLAARSERIPWVADFRDPWRDNPFREVGYAGLDALDAVLERCVMRRASHIVCNTPTHAAALAKRRPFTQPKTSTILNGFDGDRMASIGPVRVVSPRLFQMTHCGQFYGPRNPNVWLHALRSALERSPELADRLRMVFVGNPIYAGRSLDAWAEAAGVGRCVQVLGSKPHAEALALSAGSDALLLSCSVGEGASLQVPNKLFEYLALKRPILAAVAPGSPVHDILEAASADAIVHESHETEALAGAISALSTGRHASPDEAWSGVDRFDRRHRARELAEVFHRVVGDGSLHRVVAERVASRSADHVARTSPVTTAADGAVSATGRCTFW